MAEAGNVVVRISANADDFEKAITDVNKKLNNFSSKMGDIGSTMTKKVTAPIIAAGAAIGKVGQDFDDAFDNIRIGTGATGDALAGLEEDFKAVYSTVPSGMEDVSTAIADLNTRLGLTGQPLQEMSTQMLNLARITGSDVSDTIRNATRLFGDWGIAVEDQSSSLDMLFKASQATGIEINTLSSLMVQFGGPLRQLGFGFDEAAAMLAKFEKEGVNTELVVGSLRIALSKMAQEGIEDPAEALSVMIQRIKDAGSAGEANALALEMFGARAGPDMAAAIREGRMDLDELINTLAESPETINGAAEATDGFAEKMVILKNKLALAIEPLGTALLEALENLMPAFEKIIGAVTRLIEWFTNLPAGTQTAILAIVGIAAAIGPVLMVVQKLIGVFTSLSALLPVLGTVFTALTGPIGIVIAAITAVIAIGVALYKNWDEIKEFLTNTWNNIKEIASTVWESIKEFFSTIWDSIKEIANSVWEGIKTVIIEPIQKLKTLLSEAWNSIKETASTLWNSIKTVASNVWESIKTTIMKPIDTLKTLLSNAWNRMKEISSTAWNGIKSLASTVWDNIKNTIMKPIDSLKTLLSDAWDEIKQTASRGWEGMISIASGIFNKVKDAILSPFKNLHIPLPHFSFSTKQVSVAGISFSIPDVSVSWYKEGGIFTRPSLIGVGEAGDEAVIPLNSSTLGEIAGGISNKMDSEDNNQQIGNGAEATIIIPVILDGKKIAEVTAPHVDKYMTKKYKNKARGGGVL